MKHILNLIIASALSLVLFSITSCNKDDDPQSYKALFEVSYEDENTSFEQIENLNLKITNTLGVTKEVNFKEGKDTVSTTLLEGHYEIIASGNIKDAKTIFVSGTTSIDLYAEGKTSIKLSKIIQSPFVFKAIYTSWSKLRYINDTYFEIANNSDEVQYLDGLIISTPMSNQKQANAWQANGYDDLYNCGQGQVIAFPGSGKEYPVEPGKSVLIANDATDHSKLTDVEKSPDLSNADWEIYLPDSKRGDNDYAAKNMDIIFINNNFMNQFGIGLMGRCYILAKCPEGVTPTDFAANKDNIMTTPGTTSDMEFLMIPGSMIIDAVEIWDGTKTEHYPVFLAKHNAWGVDQCEKYSATCVRRKVSKIENGRPYYQDTNNCAEDFINNQPLLPGIDPTTADK